MVTSPVSPPAALRHLTVLAPGQSRLWYQGGQWHWRLQADPLPDSAAVIRLVRQSRPRRPLVLLIHGCEPQQLQPRWQRQLVWRPRSPGEVWRGRWRWQWRLWQRQVRARRQQGLTLLTRCSAACSTGLMCSLEALQVPTAVQPRPLPAGATRTHAPCWDLVAPLAIASLVLLTVDAWAARLLPPPPPRSADPLASLGDQLRHYHRQPPTVLVVGSSRAAQGVNPAVLARSLQQRTSTPQRVALLGINGLTARGVAQLLIKHWHHPDQPRVILWLDGARAFAPRPDDPTDHRLQQALTRNASGGDRPFALARQWQQDGWRRWRSPSADTALTPLGFRAVASRWSPTQPPLPGRFDRDSQGLAADQQQRLGEVLRWSRQHQRSLIFIDAPLTDAYLDGERQAQQRRFHDWLRRQPLPWRDYSRAWPRAYDRFTDPSHLNREGARALAIALAADPQIPWERWLRP